MRTLFLRGLTSIQLLSLYIQRHSILIQPIHRLSCGLAHKEICFANMRLRVIAPSSRSWRIVGCSPSELFFRCLISYSVMMCVMQTYRDMMYGCHTVGQINGIDSFVDCICRTYFNCDRRRQHLWSLKDAVCRGEYQ